MLNGQKIKSPLISMKFGDILDSDWVIEVIKKIAVKNFKQKNNFLDSKE